MRIFFDNVRLDEESVSHNRKKSTAGSLVSHIIAKNVQQATVGLTESQKTCISPTTTAQLRNFYTRHISNRMDRMTREKTQSQARIWYVEDDVSLAAATKALLCEVGFDVRIFPNAASVRQMLVQTLPDLLMLDWNLPDADGLSLCRKVRAASPELPVLMVTVRDDPHDIVQGLDSGADDYVTKPFDAGVLISRVHALLRRSSPTRSILSCGNVSIDVDAGRAFADGSALDLTAMEYRLLLLLMENKGRILTRSQLISRLWNEEADAVCDNTLTVTMKRLRSKLGPSNCIKTVRSFGYRMEEPS